VSARTRTYFFVAVAAVAAAAFVVATVAFTRTSTGGGGTPHAQPNTVVGRAPSLVLDLGVRTDPEAIALRRASRLYDRRRHRQALAIFMRYRSVQAEVGAAVARWPAGTVARLRRLASEHPRSAVVLLHLGLAELASGDEAAARQAWQGAVARDPDTQSGVHADDLLHPNYAPGLPSFVPSFGLPRSLAALPAPTQLAKLRAAATADDVRAKLLYGAALQQLGRPVSAEREFAAAARMAPNQPEPLVAAAVGAFSKSRPVRAFARLGPLSGRFPRSQTVRFHLGELLLWIGQLPKAEHQLELARAAGPRTILGTSASELLRRLPAR
jgi:tetratricopeptide (TPR) repeat protein